MALSHRHHSSRYRHQHHNLPHHQMLSNCKLFISFILIFISYHCYPIDTVQHVSGDDKLSGLDLFKIAWKGPPTDREKKFIDKYDDNVIQISTKDNEKYMCIVPGTSNLNFDTSAKNSSTSDGDKENDTPKSPIQILGPLLKGDFCSYRFELFWKYELCHGKYLRQFHDENTKYKAKITQEYYLGKMEPEQIKAHDEEYLRQQEDRSKTGESRPTILVNGHYKPYVALNMTSGTKCDLTKNSRVSRIIYVCNEAPSLELYSIKETSTCEYEAIVLSPMLCQHADFKIDTNTQHEIKCYSLDGSPMRPKETIAYEDEGVEDESVVREVSRRGGSRTLIIDMDSILSR